MIFPQHAYAGFGCEAVDVRFGSKADIAAFPRDVRFTPESGHRSEARKIGRATRAGGALSYALLRDRIETSDA